MKQIPGLGIVALAMVVAGSVAALTAPSVAWAQGATTKASPSAAALASVPPISEQLSHPRSEMREVVERWTADQAALLRRYDAPYSPYRRDRMREFHAAWRARLAETDFDALSSIGLTEHIGVHNYPFYFGYMRDKLREGGLFLNHCITRPDNPRTAKAGDFIDRYVFPDGELIGSGRIITEVHNVGIEVLHEENLREHYALTLHEWCKNLVENWDACVADVGEGTAKVWGLYMAGSRLGFQRNVVQLHQVLGVKLPTDGSWTVPLRPWWQP